MSLEKFLEEAVVNRKSFVFYDSFSACVFFSIIFLNELWLVFW